MAKLILKSPYIQCGGKDKPSGFMNYIATRDGVELLPTSGYLDYMGERKGSHGLFSDEENVDLTRAKTEIDSYTGKIWTHIISLKREDATRLGYDNASTWRNLLRSHRNEIAEAMHIPPNHFRWFAAYHDEGEHPHVHMMAYSINPEEGHLYQDGIQNIRSKLTNDIFKMELLHLYKQKSQSRDELLLEAKQVMSELGSTITAEDIATPKMQMLMLQLSAELKSHKGKKSYGYLKKPVKKLVDDIMNELFKAKGVVKRYTIWQDYQAQIESYYHQKEYRRKTIQEEKAFQPLKNHIIKIADGMDTNVMNFLGANTEYLPYHEGSYDYNHAKEIIEDDGYYLADRDKYFEKMEQLADEGDHKAQFFVGLNYQNGSFVISDGEKAKHYLELVAENDIAPAQYQLGKLLLSDDALIRNIPQGVKWLETALHNGIDYAGLLLAKNCFAENKEKTKNYLLTSAEMGNEYAQYQLGKILCHDGDKWNGMAWVKLSADQGNQYAKQYLTWMEQGYTPKVMQAVTTLLYQLSKIFENSVPSPIAHQRMDKKEFQRMIEKRRAMGIKDVPDLEEQEQRIREQTMQMY